MKEVVKIKFGKSNDYKMIPATGAWGGLSPNNEVVFDLFVEKHVYPESIELEIQNGKQAEEKQKQKEEHVFIREAQIGVVLRPDIAYSLGEWLIGKAKNAGFTKS